MRCADNLCLRCPNFSTKEERNRRKPRGFTPLYKNKTDDNLTVILIQICFDFSDVCGKVPKESQ